MEIESLDQSILVSMNDESLDMKLAVRPMKTVSIVNGDSYDEYESIDNEAEMADLPDEENEFFNDSVSVMHPKFNSEVDKVLPPILENDVESLKISNADRSKTSQTKSDKSGGSENDVQNGNPSKATNDEKQKPSKNGRKKENRRSNATNSNNNETRQQQQQQRKQQQKQQPKPHNKPQPPQQQQNRQNQSDAQQQHSNGEQRPTNSNVLFSTRARYHAHSPQNYQHRPSQFHSPHPSFRSNPITDGCPDFVASLGKSPSHVKPLEFSPQNYAPQFAGQNPYSPFQFGGMYGMNPSGQPGPFHHGPPGPFHHSNMMRPSMQFPSSNHPNNLHQRLQPHRMQNYGSNQDRPYRPVNNAVGNMNAANGNIEKRDTNETKPQVIAGATPSKIGSEKSNIESSE